MTSNSFSLSSKHQRHFQDKRNTKKKSKTATMTYENLKKIIFSPNQQRHSIIFHKNFSYLLTLCENLRRRKKLPTVGAEAYGSQISHFSNKRTSWRQRSILIPVSQNDVPRKSISSLLVYLFAKNHFFRIFFCGINRPRKFIWKVFRPEKWEKELS